ncbi:MAG TPA: hypothetical protein VMU51_24915 [Mycobacteriales bacterium]|nr:hypothetical protein [Mycobacteriales bacterium]
MTKPSGVHQLVHLDRGTPAEPAPSTAPPRAEPAVPAEPAGAGRPAELGTPARARASAERWGRPPAPGAWAHAVQLRTRRVRAAQLRAAVLRCVPAPADLPGPAD